MPIKLQWSSCRGHLKQESLVLNCLLEGGTCFPTKLTEVRYLAAWGISERDRVRAASQPAQLNQQLADNLLATVPDRFIYSP